MLASDCVKTMTSMLTGSSVGKVSLLILCCVSMSFHQPA
jgi:hypothetical protein